MSVRRAGRSVLVTGAQGFMGSRLADRLASEGAGVVVPLRPCAGGSYFEQAGLARRCELTNLDLDDQASILRVLNENDVDLVFHLAAQTIVGAATDSPLGTFEANIRGTYNLLEACRVMAGAGPVPRVVVASSYHVYGRGSGSALLEGSPLASTSPYEVSKACADFIARSYAVTYGLPVGVARLANVYGGGDLNWSRIVPDTARSLIRGGRPVIQSDGTPERDYIYVDDAVDAFLAIARSLADESTWGRAWNAGSGRPVSVLELVGEMIESAGGGVEPDVRAEPDPGAPIDRRFLDSSAIAHELGWHARWELQDGLARTLDWYRESFAA